MGIEPTPPAWKAGALPLSYTRVSLSAFTAKCQLATTEFIHKPLAGTGFEPVKALPPDLQSGPFGHSGIPPNYPQGGEPSAPKAIVNAIV